MSVSSERTCSSPSSSSDESTGCGPLKLKRRWIQMSSIDEDLTSKLSPIAVDLSISTKKPKLHSLPPKTLIQPTFTDYDYVTQVQPRYVLPEDPRDWTKRDVLRWLKYMTTTYDLDVSQDKFDMNGKALCLMTMNMFVNRVPTGGKLLYRDFRLRLYPAVFFQEKPKPDYSKLTPLEMLALTTGKYFP